MKALAAYTISGAELDLSQNNRFTNSIFLNKPCSAPPEASQNALFEGSTSMRFGAIKVPRNDASPTESVPPVPAPVRHRVRMRGSDPAFPTQLLFSPCHIPQSPDSFLLSTAPGLLQTPVSRARSPQHTACLPPSTAPDCPPQRNRTCPQPAQVGTPAPPHPSLRPTDRELPIAHAVPNLRLTLEVIQPRLAVVPLARSQPGRHVPQPEHRPGLDPDSNSHLRLRPHSRQASASLPRSCLATSRACPAHAESDDRSPAHERCLVLSHAAYGRRRNPDFPDGVLPQIPFALPFLPSLYAALAPRRGIADT